MMLKLVSAGLLMAMFIDEGLRFARSLQYTPYVSLNDILNMLVLLLVPAIVLYSVLTGNYRDYAGYALLVLIVYSAVLMTLGYLFVDGTKRFLLRMLAILGGLLALYQLL